MSTVCTYHDCDNKPYHDKGVQKHDLCRGHMGQQKRGEELRPLRKNPILICTFEGCGRPHHGKGFCLPHYVQMKRGRGMKPIREFTQECKWPGCSRKHKAKGYCATHYSQLRTTGRVFDINEHGQEVECSFPGCDKPYSAKGLCNGHYRQRYCGEALRPLRSVVRDHDEYCSRPDCNQEYFAKDLCRKHYYQKLYRDRYGGAQETKEEHRERIESYRQTAAQQYVRVPLRKNQKKPKSVSPLRPSRIHQPAFRGLERYEVPPVGVYGMVGAPFKECSHLPIAWKACKLTVEEAAWCSGLSEAEVTAQWPK